MKTPRKNSKMFSKVIIQADYQGWENIYFTQLSHIPCKGDVFDLDDRAFPDHQNILREERIKSGTDIYVKNVFHFLSENEHTISITIGSEEKYSGSVENNFLNAFLFPLLQAIAKAKKDY